MRRVSNVLLNTFCAQVDKNGDKCGIGGKVEEEGVSRRASRD